MQVIWSVRGKRIHRYERDARPSETCNIDDIKERKVAEAPDGPGLVEWAHERGLTFCKRCFLTRETDRTKL